MARRPCGMHVEDIKAALRKKYGPLSSLSKTLGYHPSTVSNVLSRPGSSIALEAKLAELLGMPPYEVWPDRYQPDGTPLSFVAPRSPIAAVPENLRRKSVAA